MNILLRFLLLLSMLSFLPDSALLAEGKDRPVSQTLKDPSGRTLGIIRMTGKGKWSAYSPSGKWLGYYEEKYDKTYLPSGRTFGIGNQLPALILMEHNSARSETR
jgi:hypothetical protein